MKLTQTQIIQLRNLREQGKGITELAEKFKVSRPVVYWHTSPSYREKMREYRRRYRKGNRKYYESQREYQKNYHKNRYNTDEEFRKKQIERVKIMKSQITQGIRT